MIRTFAILAACQIVVSPAHAGEAQAEEARAIYHQGEAEYAADQFDRAHELFKKAYLLSRSPALLYNMGSALERAGHPRQAAEELRAYLRAVPDSAERAEIEGRIRGLDEAQRILDAEALKNAPPRLIEFKPPPPFWTRKKTLYTVIGVIAGAAVVTGLGVGLTVGLRQDYPASTLQTQRATP